MPKIAYAWIGALLLLSACDQGGPPPSVAIIAPANDATVSGNAAVQVTLSDDTQNGEISVYARARDSQETGRLVGTVNSSPYILSWNTTSLPAGNALELYAKATVKGATGTSTPVRVNIQNATAPTMRYLVAYNLPANLTGVAGQSLQGGTLSAKLHLPDPAGMVTSTSASAPAPVAPSPLTLRTQANDRQLWAEWSWNAVDGAASYKVLFSNTSIAGPYTVMRNQAASAGTVVSESWSTPLTDASVGQKVYGTILSSSAARVDSAMSNAQVGVFLDTQQVASPLNGQTVADGRPILTWTPLTGVSGYVFFLCDRPCTDAASQYKWTNYQNPGLTTSLSAVYPSTAAALPKGTYYWWVAGVRNAGGVPVSLSYSEMRSLVVP